MVLARRALFSLAAAAVVTLSSSIGASSAANFSTAARAVDLDGWYPCELARSSSRGAQCAIFQAPLCYDGICATPATRTIDVFVKRVVTTSTSSSAEPTPNAILIQVGSGSATLNIETAMRSLHSALGGDVNVYTIDRRGMGRSTKLDCVAAQAQSSNSPGGTSISADEVASCADELQSNYGGDLSSFSVTSAAMDIQYFIRNFLNGTATFVYGAGFGSSIVERLIHLNTNEIAGYILDGAITTSGLSLDRFEYHSKWDQDFDLVGEEFLALCDNDRDTCGKYFPDGSASTALRAVEASLVSPSSECGSALDAQLAKVFDYSPGDYPPTQAFRWAMGELLTRPLLRKFIPVVTYRLARCSADDAKVLSHFFEVLSTTLHSASQQDSSRNSLLYKLVTFSELWETPAPSEETMQARFFNASISTGTYPTQLYCAFSKEDSPACQPYATSTSYAASPLVYKKDQYWNVAAQPPANVSVLLLSGKLDPQAPHKFAQNALETLNTTNKMLVAFDYATNGALWSTHAAAASGNATCGIELVASYIRQLGSLAETDTSCVAQVPALNFTLPNRLVATWLNASSAFDGKFVSSTTPGVINKAFSSPYKLAFIALVVLLVLVLVVGCVMVSRWRKAKKERMTFCADESAYNASFS